MTHSVAIPSPLIFPQPSLQELKTPADLNLSMKIFHNALFTEKPDDVLQTSYGYIDVHDVAVAHVAALRNEAAGGERIIIAEGTWHNSWTPL